MEPTTHVGKQSSKILEPKGVPGKGRKVSPAALTSAMEGAKIIDNTTTYKHIVINRNLIRIKLRDQIKHAEGLRETEKIPSHRGRAITHSY